MIFFFPHQTKNSSGLAIYRAYGPLQNHAWGWGQGMCDITSCLNHIASVLKS